jgi:hypothetical protein
MTGRFNWERQIRITNYEVPHYVVLCNFLSHPLPYVHIYLFSTQFSNILYLLRLVFWNMMLCSMIDIKVPQEFSATTIRTQNRSTPNKESAWSSRKLVSNYQSSILKTEAVVSSETLLRYLPNYTSPGCGGRYLPIY